MVVTLEHPEERIWLTYNQECYIYDLVTNAVYYSPKTDAKGAYGFAILQSEHLNGILEDLINPSVKEISWQDSL